MSDKAPSRDLTPQALALALGAIPVGGIVAALVTEMAIGRPSSTAGVVLVFAPIYGAMFAGAGLLLGYLARLVARLAGWESPVTRWRSVALTVLVVVTGSAAYGVKRVVDYEHQNAPGVLHSAGGIARTTLPRGPFPQFVATCTRLWERGSEATGKLAWNGLPVSASGDPELRLQFGSQRQRNYDVSRFSYVTRVEAVVLPAGVPADNHLAVLVKLRATSFRSLLLLYSASGDLVHEELLERCGGNSVLAVAQDEQGAYLYVNVCEPIAIRATHQGGA